MLVKDIMTSQVVAIGPDLPIRDAIALMAQRGVRHFPIVQAAVEFTPGTPGKLVGIVSDRDLRVVGSEHPGARPSVGVRDPVASVMCFPVLTAHPLEPIEEAARAMRRYRVGAMPIVRDEELVGIITSADLLAALVRMTGVAQGSRRFEIELPNHPTALASLLGLIASRDASVHSLMVTSSDAEVVTYVLHIANADHSGMLTFLRGEGVAVL